MVKNYNLPWASWVYPRMKDKFNRGQFINLIYWKWLKKKKTLYDLLDEQQNLVKFKFPSC